MKSIIGAFLFVLSLTSLALAVPISGTLDCDAPDPQHTIPAGDHPNHAVLISQYKCTWSYPMKIDGVATKDGTSFESGVQRGNTIHVNGLHTTNMDNPEKDKIFVTYDGKTTLKDNKPFTAKGTWTFDGGTGRFEKIKGKGYFDGKATANGGVSFKVTGDYKL